MLGKPSLFNTPKYLTRSEAFSLVVDTHVTKQGYQNLRFSLVQIKKHRHLSTIQSCEGSQDFYECWCTLIRSWYKYDQVSLLNFEIFSSTKNIDILSIHLTTMLGKQKEMLSGKHWSQPKQDIFDQASVKDNWTTKRHNYYCCWGGTRRTKTFLHFGLQLGLW